MFYKMFKYKNEFLFLAGVKLSVHEMKWNLMKVIVFSALFSLASGQFLDLSSWWDEDEGNDKTQEESDHEGVGDIWFFEEEDNSMKLLKMSTSTIQDEKKLLEESSELIVNEITNELREDLIEANAIKISEIISDRTVELFNVLHLLKSHEDEKNVQGRRFNVDDIFVWSNDSTNKINEIIDSYYNTQQ